MRAKLLALGLLILCTAEANAQLPKDHVGREFFVVFGPNTGGEPSGETENAIKLNFLARNTANVRVRIVALRYDTTIIVEAGRTTTLDLPNGNNGSRTTAISTKDSITVGGAVRITADNEIKVFGLNSKRFSQDAFLALPIDALGVEYRIVSYQGSPSGQGIALPGQFMVAAIEDNTIVTVTPRCKTITGIPAGTTKSFEMKREDALLIQSDLASLGDLTGSHVTSNKPIAVFGGHERTAMPYDAHLYDGSPPSRDHLCEQLPPVTAFGDSFYVAPFTTTQAPDVVRVVSSAETNIISINGVIAATLGSGEFHEIKALKESVQIVTSKPSIVVQYMHTSMGQFDDPQFPSYGDPSMMIVPPVEQHLKEYSFHSYPADKSFITVVFPASAYSSIRIDDRPLDEVKSFIAGDYAYATREIAAGLHSVRSSTPVGVSVYGFTDVASFAMPAGMGVEPGGLTRSSVPEEIDQREELRTVIAAGGRFTLSPSVIDQHLEIFDRVGRRMGSQQISASSDASIDVSTYPRGLYFFSVMTEKGKTWGSLLIR
jgi:hypothetical protein